MAWRFPDKKEEPLGIINTEDTNRSFISSAEELTGKLNEQNVAAGAFSDTSKYEKTVAYRHAKTEVLVDGYTVGDNSGYPYRYNPILFAVKLNGAFIPESLDGNISIARYQNPIDTGNRQVFSVNIDLVVPVLPGRTTVEVVAKVRSLNTDQKYMVPMVGSRSLILWEISN